MSGRSDCKVFEKVGIIFKFPISPISPFDDLGDLGDFVTKFIPASFASWKKVLMVIPVPVALRHLLYCVSVSCSE